jgi:alanyl-tRNA synthetase
VVDAEDGTAFIVLEKSPFYAASGGQVSDAGVLRTGDRNFQVIDVLKTSRTNTLRVALDGYPDTPVSDLISSGDSVTAVVDSRARDRSSVHHTATHAVQAALKEVAFSEFLVI